jgi:cell division septum initiation protein DivIVA
VTVPVAPPLREQTSPNGEHNVQAARVLGLAQEMADRLTGEAKAKADGMLSHARIASEQLLFVRRRRPADAMVTEARTPGRDHA